jgi:hypothetical protein
MAQSLGGTALFILVIGLATPAKAADFPCPEPTQQTASNIKADVAGQAQTFLKLGAAELKGTVEKTVVNLFEKYPNADRVVMMSNVLSTTCNLIKNSTQLSDSEKFDKWLMVFPLIQGMK